MGDDDEAVARAKRLPWRERVRHDDYNMLRDAHLDLAAVCRTITDPTDHRIHEFGELRSSPLQLLRHPRFALSINAFGCFDSHQNFSASWYRLASFCDLGACC